MYQVLSKCFKGITHLNLITLCSRHQFHCFRDEETEAQGGNITCSGSYREQPVGLAFEPVSDFTARPYEFSAQYPV